MSSLVEIENIIHKARIEQMKGNVSASLLLYNQAMNAIDAKMEEKLPQKESETLSNYMNNVLEEFDLISNANPNVHVTEDMQNQILNSESVNQTPISPVHSESEQEEPNVQHENLVRKPSEQQLRTPVSAVPTNPIPRTFPPAPYPNTNTVQNIQPNQPMSTQNQPNTSVPVVFKNQPQNSNVPIVFRNQPTENYPNTKILFPQIPSTTNPQQIPIQFINSNPEEKKNTPTPREPDYENPNGISLLHSNTGVPQPVQPKQNKPSQWELELQAAWNQGVQNMREYWKDPHVCCFDIDIMNSL